MIPSLVRQPRGGPEARATAERLERERRRAEAEGIIRVSQHYCQLSCPRRESCPGMECKIYREEAAAKDVLLSLDDAVL